MPATAPPPRRYVPASLDLADWSAIEPLYRDLLARSIESPAELETWLLDLSELSAVVDEYGSRRAIEMSCHTDDKEIEAAFLHYVEKIEPHIKPLFFELQKKLIASPHLPGLKGRRFEVLVRQWRADVEKFREENIPLETQNTRLNIEYDKLVGAMMVNFRGRDYTQQQLVKFQEETDRDTREQAWRIATTRRMQDREAIEQIFEKQLALRHQMALNAGLSDFRAYMWKALKRFDYTPDDCTRFAEAIERRVVPLVDELNRRRAEELKLQPLRPWDLAVDPKNRPPLRPFVETDIDGFVAKTHAIFQRLSPRLADDFDLLRQHNNLDLDSRKGKRAGGYQQNLNEIREPFIFMNAAGVQRDVETLLHEGGHAFHMLASRDEPILFLREAPIEFCEVVSMSMELLAAEHLDLFYSPQDHVRARQVHLEGIIRGLPWIATIDQFQHWLYTHPGHSRSARTEKWLELNDRFGARVDWTGIEAIRATRWQAQLHLFHVPFYYVEYGIAQLGALQIWTKAMEDPSRALSNYQAGLKLGGTRPLPELFAAAGIVFDFSERTLGPLIQAAADELERLGA